MKQKIMVSVPVVLTGTTGCCTKTQTSRSVKKWCDTHKSIVPVTLKFGFLMQRHMIRHVSLSEDRNIDQNYVFRSLLPLHSLKMGQNGSKWAKYVQQTIIWSHLVSKVIVFRSKCETTRLVMDPNDTLWLLRPQGVQNCDNWIFHFVQNLPLKRIARRRPYSYGVLQ